MKVGYNEYLYNVVTLNLLPLSNNLEWAGGQGGGGGMGGLKTKMFIYINAHFDIPL